ncbi:MAG TPA: Crp/Fnr family transcriptional regulator [Candidatus Binataceae bacterium]|nr:Crp/Fnr family transcriptional regulator [Candidatus Binataceae bacterium]
MKRARSSKPAHKVVGTELAEPRSAGEARKLRVELSALRGLGGLSSEQFGALVGQLRVRSFRKRAIIYSAEQLGDTIHIMLSGIARITSVNRKNERVLLEVLGPGDVVCIPTLLPDLRHSLECEAFTECQIGVLSAQALVESLGLQYDQFLLALRLTMGRWWGLLVRQSHFVDQTLEERIAVALLDLADKFGLPDTRGTIINVRFGHRNIADLVSGSRPKVSLCLGRFAMEGALIQERRRIIVVPSILSAILSRSFERR